MFMTNMLLPCDFKPETKKQTHAGGFLQSVMDPQNQKAADQEKFLLCARCFHVITHPSLRIIVNGAHEHTFANPHGIVFEIGCFRSAIGCGYYGPPSHEFSWFAGFMWQVAVCGSCLAHVGWLFSSPGADSFIGLILDRMIEASSP
jgi:uncharacterized C2H2 Zn-finger protein